MVKPCWTDQTWFPDNMRLAMTDQEGSSHQNGSCGMQLKGRQPQVMRDIRDWLEVLITVFQEWNYWRDCKETHFWIESISENYQWMFEQWYSFYNQKELPTLKVYVSNPEYLDLPQVIHEYSYRMLSTYATEICSILQPTLQERASLAPTVWQLLEGIFRRNPPTRVWAKIQVAKKVIDLLLYGISYGVSQQP